MTGSTSLAGKRILIIEDEIMVRMLFEDMLTDLGCEIVGGASRIDAAVAMAASVDCDVAILDVNLDGEQTFPVADVLKERRIPFIFATGYSAIGIPEAHGSAPRLQKPFRQRDLARVLETTLAASRSGE